MIFELIQEPFTISGEGEYNINGVTEITVIDSFMGLDPDVRGCQINGSNSYQECVRVQQRQEILDHCKCLPFSILDDNDFKKVSKIISFFISFIFF